MPSPSSSLSSVSSFHRAVAGFLALVLAFGPVAPLTLQAQTAAPAAGSTGSNAPDGGWPKTLQGDTTTFTLYQPQIESLQNNVLTAQIAIGAQDVGATGQRYGTISIKAQADIDKESNLVTLQNIQITQSSFPGAPAGAQYRTSLQGLLAAKPMHIALGRVEASLAIAQASASAPALPIQNNAPRVIFSQTPATLVLVDGQPVLRDFSNTGYLRVINTRALILLDQNSGTYYLRLLGAWMQASALTGPWTITSSPPANLAAALTAAQGTEGIDLMDPTSDSKFTAAQVTVYVSTTPTELVQTNGAPDFAPISGTQLLYAQNTQSQLFMYLPNQNYYFLVSGRWFQSTSLQNGPWTYVAHKDLPADFAKIPAEHPAGGALVSVPGTAPAQEAVIANTIPQTATVKRTGPTVQVDYDGAPQFQPIPDTSLQYAVNTRTPVIQVTPSSYYLVHNGVWFAGPAATGPWAVTDTVPASIYTIPVSSPLHYVTYVKVYNSTPDTVVVGYTPGYLGTVVAPSNVVVYGTGYVYPVYCNTFWVPPPFTYGWGCGFSCGFGAGFAFGFTAGWFVGSWCHPCWGGFGWNNVTINNYNHYSFNHWNSYNHWNNNLVQSHNNSVAAHTATAANPAASAAEKTASAQHLPQMQAADAQSHPTAATAKASPSNNVMAGKDGQVYRSTANGVEQRDGDTWKPAAQTSAETRAAQNQAAARDEGERRTANLGYGTSRTAMGGFGGGADRGGFETGGARMAESRGGGRR
jgi:hypothetical protein